MQPRRHTLGLGSVTTVGSALGSGVEAFAFAPASGPLNVVVMGLAGYLVGRAVGAPWTVALSSAVFDFAGMAASTAYVANKKGK